MLVGVDLVLVVEHFALLVLGLGVLALAHLLEVVDHLFLNLHPLGAVEVLGVDEEGPPP